MHTPTAAQLLDAWERGIGGTSEERALALLTAAYPESPWEELAALPLGRRDLRLLALRERIFGPQLVALAACPHCGERVELTFQTDEIRATSELEAEVLEPLALTVGKYRLHFRLPDSRDMAAIASLSDAEAASMLLLQRCLLSAHKSGKSVQAETLPAEVRAAVATTMAQADPQADVQLALCCPACERGWQAHFDIVAFLWMEVQAWAERLLQEVHQLASSYGWREADILAMSALRRQLYLERCLG